MKRLEKTLPPGLHIEITSDDTEFVKESIDEVRFQLIVGGIMAALVVLCFLNNIRTAVFSSLAIPTSIISTFAIIYACGFTLNNLTMLALVSAVGLVIDDSIIMEENIYRHRFGLGKSALRAAIDGSREIGFAVVAATLTLAGVFLPVAFMGGLVGRFFEEFALTMAFAVACSMLVALTIEPMLASRFLKPLGEDWRIFKWFNLLMRKGTATYRRHLAWFLNHRYVVILIVALSLGLGGIIFLFLEKEFVTAEDRSQFIVLVENPLSYSIYKTDQTMQQVEEIIQEIPEMDNFFSLSGLGGGMSMGSNKGIIFVNLIPKNKRKKNQQDLMAELRRELKQIPDLLAVVSDVGIMGGASRSEEVQFVIQGPSLEGLDKYSREVMARLSQISGFVDLDRNLDLDKPEVRIKIDRNKAADLGVDIRTIAEAVGALIGGINVAEFKSEGESYDVRLRLLETERTLPTDVDRIWIHTKKGEIVDLGSFVTIETGVGPSIINRLDRQKSVAIYANLGENLKLGEAKKKIDAALADVLPDEYTFRYAGRSETYGETLYYIAFAFLLAIILTYLVLSSQFESFVFPFSIMMGLPLAFVGAFGFLLIFRNSFNLYSMLAMILLVGLPTKNGILLIDLTNQMRRKGMAIKEALIKAAGIRLRPILMTAASTMAGVIPVALGIGVGSESRQGMALAIAGGMLSSTILTLMVVPVIYSYLDSFTRLSFFSKIKGKLWVEENETEKPEATITEE